MTSIGEHPVLEPDRRKKMELWPCRQVAGTDVLVLGAGISGSRAALAAHQAGADVAIAHAARGASPFIIGANVPLGDEGVGDEPEAYAGDMLAGGFGLCERPLVEALAKASVPAFQNLCALDVPFAHDEKGYRQRHLSGNRFARSVYVPEGTGRAILGGIDKELGARGVRRMAGHEAICLVRHEGRVCGAVLKPPREDAFVFVPARITVLALGGIGRLYRDTTYPADIVGDGLVLALEAGARLIDMEFVQFEPVVTHEPEGARGMEMPTAMLGDGAHLLNNRGERFMFRYNPGQGERGIEKAMMALCIAREVAEGRGFEDGTVRFDTTVLPAEKLESYRHHCQRLRKAGLDPAREGPLVRPMAHSIMGGVRIDETGHTGVAGLYACGETTGGIHGASRIAGNGGGETMTMGWLVGRAAAGAARDMPMPDASGCVAALREALPSTCAQPEAKRDLSNGDALLAEIRTLVEQSAGLFRDADELSDGLRALDTVAQRASTLPRHDTAHALTARKVHSAILLARIVLEAALLRGESRGAHQRRDHPQTDDARWQCHIAWTLDAGRRPIPEIIPVRQGID